MKRFALLTLIIAAAICATGQQGDPGQQLIRKKCSIERVSLPPDKYGQDFPQLFQQIHIIDARPDTTRIGIVRTGKAGQRELLLHHTPAMDLGDYLNGAYSKAGGRFSLLIVLKDLWVSTPDSFEMKGHNEWNVRFRVEAYVAGKDGYQPLIRMDSTVTGARGADGAEVAQVQIRELFDVFMGQAADSDPGRERRSVSYRQIDSFNRTRFAYPMDTATIFAKGVYATQDDFWNNSPTILKYSIDTDASGAAELSLPDETGRLIFNHTVWGYCDGSRPYVMMDGNFYPIFNVGHQFYVMGSKEYRKRTHAVGYSLGTIIPYGDLFVSITATAAVEIKGNTTRTLRVFRINPETGQVTE